MHRSHRPIWSRVVISSELSASDVTGVRWKYPPVKEVDGTQQTREVVETKSGSLDRDCGQAAEHLRATVETERILRISHNPEEQRKLEPTRKKDAEQCDAFFRSALPFMSTSRVANSSDPAEPLLVLHIKMATSVQMPQ